MATNPAADYFATHPSHQPPKGSSMAANANVSADIPDRYESFLLADGEKKVTMEIDTRMPNTSIFTFNREDHTLGNLLRARLLQNPHVMFSGYKVEHPLFPKFILRVQTDGEITPKAAVLGSCKDLVNDLGTFSREFTKEWELRKMVGAGAQQNGQNGY